MFARSPRLSTALATLPPEPRAQVEAALQSRARDAEVYEILVLLLGPVGLSRLYLKDGNGFALRALTAVSLLALTFTGLSLVSGPILLAAVLALILQAGLWAHDYATLHRQLERFHGALEARVLAFVDGSAPAG